MSNSFVSRGKSRLVCYKKQGFEIVTGLNEFNDVLAFNYKSTTIVGLYRGFKLFDGETETSNFFRLLNDLNLLDPEREIVVVGDFNIDQQKNDTRLHRELNDWVLEKGLTVIKTGITRARLVCDALQESELDLVITNSNKIKIEKEFKFINWKFDEFEANEFLQMSLVAKPIKFENVVESNYQIMASVLGTLSKFVKRRTLIIRNSDQVTSPLIQRLKNRKNRLQKIWSKDRCSINWVNFIRSSRDMKREVRRVKNNIIKSRLNKGPKEFWSQINQMMGKDNNILDKILDNGEEIGDKKVIADKFIDYFTSKVNNLLDNYVPLNIPKIQSEIIPFSDEEVDKAFQHLSNKKSSSMDNVSGYFLKIMKPTLLPNLVELFNLIMKEGTVPSTWKIAKISPVFKKGNRTELGNYRPVSNLNAVSKLFELCLLIRMEQLDFDYLMGSFQHGFRKLHSTDTAILDLVENVTQEVECKRLVCVYSVDLTAAFDLLRKEILITQLLEKNVPKYLINLIANYISDRYGFVQIENHRSCVKKIRAGCIQGSIIGPLLFNIYTSKLQETVAPFKAVSYADDAYIVVSADSLSSLKNQVSLTLNSHFEWLKSIGMECNLSKTELITFFDDEIEIEIGGSIVKSKKNLKALGLTLDKKLLWNDHVENIIKRCRAITFGLRYIRNNVDLEVMLSVLCSQVVSRISYGAAVWSHRLSFLLKTRIRSAYFKILRIMERDFEFKLNQRALLLKTSQEDIDMIFFKRTSVALFRIINSIQPSEVASTLLSKSYYNERTPNRLSFFDTSRTKFGKACLSNKAGSIIKDWNFDWLALSPFQFKKQLAAHLNNNE